MACDFASLRTALAATPLAGRKAVELPVLDTPECAFAVEIRADEIFSAWGAARAVFGQTGRWPVAVGAWGARGESWEARFSDTDLFSRFYFEESTTEDVSPKGIIARAAAVDVDAFLDALGADCPDLEESWDRGAASDDSHLSPWSPPPWLPLALLFLPTPAGWELLAYLHWYAAGSHDSALFVALLQRWSERFGAELVAHQLTALEFAVERPPRDTAAALELAREQVLVAPCTTLLPGVGLDRHARALVGRRHWLLHEKP